MMTTLWRFLCGNKKYWLIPLVLLLLVVAFLVYIASGPEPSPMMYTFF